MHPVNGNGTQRAQPEGTAKPQPDPGHASSTLKQAVSQILDRERALVSECDLLRVRVEDLERALEQRQAAFAREHESRRAHEKQLADTFSRLSAALACERKVRAFTEETLRRERRDREAEGRAKEACISEVRQELESLARAKTAQDAALAGLRKDLAASAAKRQEQERLLLKLREQAMAERKARLAAENRAAKAAKSVAAVERRLLGQKELQRLVQRHLAGPGAKGHSKPADLSGN